MVNVAYVRVSTVGQEDGVGREVQIKGIAAFAAGLGEEVNVWLQDTASGATALRAGYQEALRLAYKKELGKLFVYRMDRLARDPIIMEQTVRAVEAAGGEVVSVTEAFPRGPVGDLMRQIMAAIASYERMLIRSRTTAGKKLKVAEQGTYAGGSGCYGYRPVGSGLLEVVPEEAVVVQTIFRLRKKSWSYGKIAKALNDNGALTKQGASWTGKAVHRVALREDVYRGLKPIVGGEKGICAHAPIIEG